MKLLQELYQIHSPSGKEYPLVAFVCQYVKEHIPEAQVRLDSWGNIYITKGDAPKGYPTLCCHLDQVQKLHSDDFKVVQTPEMIYGYSEANKRREGLGADDKNGVWICLRCLEECPCLKIFMAVMEEKGMFGSKNADMSFFDDSLYVIEPDSPEGSNVKHDLREIPCSSEDFIHAAAPEEHGFKVVAGKGTDLLALKMNGLQVSCMNVAAGYYHPHKDDEYTLIADLLQSLDYVKFIVSNISQRFPHTYQTETQKWMEKNSINECSK